MPKVANGIHLDADIARARAENLEFEARGNLIAHRAGVVRLLSYLNQADMGNYEEAIADYLDHETTTPEIIVDAPPGTPQIRLRPEFRAGNHVASGRVRPPRLERRPQRVFRLHGR